MDKEECINCRNLIFLSYMLGLDRINRKCEKCGEVLNGNVKAYAVAYKI